MKVSSWLTRIAWLSLAGGAPGSLAATEVHHFPAHFSWCVATSAHQTEGNNVDSDWWEFEKLAGKVKNQDRSGLADDHWNRLEEDIALIKDLHADRYRFSIEWAKIEPKPGQWNWDAVAHYQKEISRLRASGITPFVTLLHFTLPRWIADRGGWSSAETPLEFEKYVHFVVENIGSNVQDWVTINEPALALILGYSTGEFAPGKSNANSELLQATKNLLRAHALAYATIHKQLDARGSVRVGLAHHLAAYRPRQSWNALDILAAQILSNLNNWTFFEAVETGKFKLNIPFLVNVDETIPGLAHSQDFIGVNYYTRKTVHFSTHVPGFISFAMPAKTPVSDLGWEIYPEGILDILREVSRRAPGRPILITENGIADSKDAKRTQFLEDHLRNVYRAIQEGIPVEGYCHWSLLDNFEWAQGFSPRFGLYEVNYTDLTRRPRPSARFFSKIAAENGF